MEKEEIKKALYLCLGNGNCKEKRNQYCPYRFKVPCIDCLLDDVIKIIDGAEEKETEVRT